MEKFGREGGADEVVEVKVVEHDVVVAVVCALLVDEDELTEPLLDVLVEVNDEEEEVLTDEAVEEVGTVDVLLVELLVLVCPNRT